MQNKAKTIDQYLEGIPENRQEACRQLRKLCLETLIGYEESMAYGMPCYKNQAGEVEEIGRAHV